jgi:site-specific DNA-methyltransferase (adenine-specific)
LERTALTERNSLQQGISNGMDQDVKYLDSEEERIGHPTQKTVGLWKRIIETSSKGAEVILDPL